MALRQREELGQWKDVRYYELDDADLDRKCAHTAQQLCGPDQLFLWYWFRPDVTERDEAKGWDRIPGIPLVQPPQAGEEIQLPLPGRPDLLRRYTVLQSVRVRMDNYGWCIVREVY